MLAFVHGALTRREPVPPIPCRAPLRVSPQYRAVSLEKLVRKFGQPAAAQDALMVPVHLKCSLPSPSSRPVSGAYRVDSVVNSPMKLPGRSDRPCGERPLGAGLLLCDARLVEDARHHDRWEAPLRSRRAEPPSAREPITLHAPVPPVPCRSPLSLSSPMLRSFSGKLVGKFRQPAIAARDARTGPGTPHSTPDSTPNRCPG